MIYIIEVTVHPGQQNSWSYVYGLAYTKKWQAERKADEIEKSDSLVSCTIKEITLVK